MARRRRFFRCPPEQLKELRLLVVAGHTVRDAAKKVGLAESCAYRAARGLRRRGLPPKLSVEQVDELRRRRRAGESVASLSKTFGMGLSQTFALTSSLRRMVSSQAKAYRPAKSHRAKRHLSREEREEIARGILQKESAAEIGRRLGRNRSTISREVKRGGGRGSYRAWKADDDFQERLSRPKQPKLAAKTTLRAAVENGLSNFWSPQQISGQLRRVFPNDSTMHVSHETIYRSLYVQGRGALRAELKLHLRQRQKNRRRKSSRPSPSRFQDMIAISERPAEVADRAVPGHWEGDLLIGRNGKSAIATLVERKSRFVMLVALPNGRTAEEVRNALAAQIKTLPEHLRRTLTWDQGSEMAQHAAFTVDSGVQVYFCDPHSPWQRGSNENTNGLLRQFLPSTADLRQRSQSELDRIAALLNGRPRQTLRWMTPSQALNQAVAMTG